MNRLSKFVTISLLLLQAAPLLADTPEHQGSAAGVAIDLLLLVAGLLCFVICTKIFTLLKGGELSPGWQMLSVSFLIFSLSQVLSLTIQLDIIALHRLLTGCRFVQAVRELGARLHE